MTTERHKQPLSTVFGLPPEQRERITPAVLVFGLLVSTALVMIQPFNDYMLMNTPIASNQFPLGAFAVLLFLTVVVNSVLRKMSPRLALSPAQLAAIWILILVTSTGMMNYFVPKIVPYHYYASPENRWDEIIGDQIPPQLLVSNEPAVKTFFEGLPPGESIPWRAWLVPVTTWGIYVMGLYAMMIGLSVMLRRRWVEQERFTFPMVQVSVAVISAPQPGALLNDFLRNKLVWIAVVLLIVIHSLRGLHQFYPAIPLIPLRSRIIFEEQPLSWAGDLCFFTYPLMIGFAYLLPSEVSFSLWFFRFFFAFQMIMMGVLGLPTKYSTINGNAQWGVLQSGGATIALALWFIWAGREHFANIFRKAFMKDSSIKDADESLGYRATAVLFLGGIVVQVVWLAHFGGSLPLALLIVVIGIMMYITLAWMVAQAGLLLISSGFLATELAVLLTGSVRWSTRGLLINTWSDVIFRRDPTELMLASLLNAHKISDPTNLQRRSLLKICAVAIILVFFASLIASIGWPYRQGGALAGAHTYFYQQGSLHQFIWTASLESDPLNFSVGNIGHILGGFLLIAGMIWLRIHTSWFALHPIGFLMCSIPWMNAQIWFCAFLGWLIKGAIMRWGGYKTYQTVRPFFFGLIIGDCLAGAIWIVVGLVTKVSYSILPN